MLKKINFHLTLEKLIFKIVIVGIIFSQLLTPSPNLLYAQGQGDLDTQGSATSTLEEEDAYYVVHEPIYPDSYPDNYAALLTQAKEAEDILENEEKTSDFSGEEQKSRLQTVSASDEMTLEEFNQTFPEKGEKMGHEANTLTMKDYSVTFVPDYGNLGYGADFDYLNTLLNQNYAVAVGQNNIQTFFGHYYNLSNNGVFNPLADMDLLHDGVEVIVTDEKGFSKGYLITQTMEFLHPDQIYQYYGDDFMPNLAYNGNGSDMIYIQYCRWDISLGLLITNIGYRIW